MDEGGAGVLTVCFHGAESTGKSVMAARLHDRFGWPVVAEYGREYCEANGTDLAISDLLAIAQGHAEATAAAAQSQPDVLLLDTDPLMTAAWAQMLFDRIPPALMGHPKADLYLLFEADVPWIADGTRFFGEPAKRRHFAELAEAILRLAKVPWIRVSGPWAEREAQIVKAIGTALATEP